MPSKQRMLTFRGGGWVILLAVLLTIALATWALLPAFMRGPVDPAARTPDDYGFDLTNLRVPKSELVAALPHKDFLPRWDHPPLVPAMAVGEQIRFGREKYLVSTDRVIGVTIAGESRTYPVSVLTVHEIINDTLADTPIAITYHPWCDSVVVFERVVNGETVEFGSSGLLFNSNMILFDRRKTPGDKSLFLQLTGEPIAGPAMVRGEALEILPVALTTWGKWHEANPQASVIGWDESLTKRYEGSAPDQYFRSDELAFPVKPLPPANGPAQKDRIMAVTVHGAQRVYPVPYIAAHVDENAVLHDMVGGAAIEIRYDPDYHSAVLIEPSDDHDVHVIYALWFAWFAAHGGADVVGLAPSGEEAREVGPG